jgi:hypothetical protein
MRRLVLALWCLLAPSLAWAQPSEHEVKAAFLFRFLPFIEWPAASFASPEAAIAVGVAGAPEIEAELRNIVPGRIVQGRSVSVQPVREGALPAGLHVLFIGRDALRPRELAAVAGAPMLVVMETPGGLERGAVVNFVLSEGRVRFEVALDEAERRGLRISSRMLAVALRVRPSKL